MQNIVIGIVALLVIAAGAYAFLTNQRESDSMMEDQSGAMKKDESTDTEMMEKEETMMKDTSGSETMQKDESMMQKDSDEQMVSKGSYEPYSPEKLALASGGKVVLYFHADWCPICRPLDAAFKAGVPEGIHILKVDYDTATELKQKYGVTYQHTFVQVDAAGKLINKWGDAFTAADVFARVQ